MVEPCPSATGVCEVDQNYQAHRLNGKLFQLTVSRTADYSRVVDFELKDDVKSVDVFYDNCLQHHFESINELMWLQIPIIQTLPLPPIRVWFNMTSAQNQETANVHCRLGYLPADIRMKIYQKSME